MKVLTWNINGIRASKRSVQKVLDSLDADIICLQETKITRDMLDEPTAIVDGYNAYFSFSRKRSGYSGVANFCKDSTTPTGAEEGLSGLLTNHGEGRVGGYGSMHEFGSELLNSLDAEGRAVITRHQIQLREGDIRDLTLINVYVPRAAASDDRWAFKQRFLALLQCRAEALLREGSHVIILGDINTTHKKMDHCDPTTQEFLRVDSRQWINQLLREEDRDPEIPPIEDRSLHKALTSHAEGGHFIDAFRYFQPDRVEAYTNWSTVTSARETNYGKRLDYIFVDTGLKDCLVHCEIMPNFEGSDHCPVVVELSCTPVPYKTCPPICTRLMPEFQGKQQKLSSFFARVGKKKSAAKVERNGSDDSEKGPSEDSDLSGSSQPSDSNVPSQSSISNPPALPSLAIPGTQMESKVTSNPLVHAAAGTVNNTDYSMHKGVNVEPTKAGLKRAGSEKFSDNNSKKKKKGRGSESNASGKQSSLLGFFKKPVPSSSVSTDKRDSVSKSKYWGQPNDKDTEKSKGESPEHNDGNHSTADTPGKQSNAKSPEKSFTSASLSSLQCIIEVSDKCGTATANTTTPENTAGAETSKSKASSLWKGLLSGPPPAPLCKGHREPCVLRTVRKPGPTKNKQFYVCARPEGASTNKEARCDYFQWVNQIPAGKKGKT